MNTVQKRLLIFMLAGFLLGILWFASLRFLLAQDKTVHYHANFALYINGQKDPFDDFTQYEEVQACSGETLNNPKGRAHLHKPNTHVVHVHDHAVTWNTFFGNVGYGLTDQAIVVDGSIFIDGQNGNRLHFILNGEKVDTIANRVIENKDVLLVSYGNEQMDVLQKRYDDIPKDAEKMNQQYDPASCSGTKELSVWDRLVQAFNFTK